MTVSQLIEKMKHKYTPNKEIWRLIRNRIIQIKNNNHDIKLTKEEEQKIEDYVIEKVKSITLTYNANISVRLMEKIKEIFYRFKLFFDVIDWDYCKKLCDPYFLNINATENFINKAILANGGGIKIKELAQIIADFENVSLRTAYRRINEFCEANQDKLIIGKREIKFRDKQSF